MEWYRNLPTRDRRALLVGGVALLLTLFYVMIWQPLHTFRDDSQSALERNQKLYSWMQDASSKAIALGAGNSSAKPVSDGRSLLGVVDTTLRQARLNKEAKRIEPDGDKRVRVWMEQVPFDAMVRWLGKLETSRGIAVLEMRVDDKAANGRVDARLTLAGAGA